MTVLIIELPTRSFFLVNYVIDGRTASGKTIGSLWAVDEGEQITVNLRNCNFYAEVSMERAELALEGMRAREQENTDRRNKTTEVQEKAISHMRDMTEAVTAETKKSTDEGEDWKK